MAHKLGIGSTDSTIQVVNCWVPRSIISVLVFQYCDSFLHKHQYFVVVQNNSRIYMIDSQQQLSFKQVPTTSADKRDGSQANASCENKMLVERSHLLMRTSNAILLDEAIAESRN